MLHNLRGLALFVLIAVVCTFSSAPPARASFGDCNDPHYLGLFDPRLASATGFLCTEGDPTPVTSDAGVTHIRIIQHLLADWATAPGATRAIKDGIVAAAAAMPRLGHFRIHDVTILLVDGLNPRADAEGHGQIAAWTNNTGDECLITVWLLGPGATEQFAGSVISHELFHCVEFGSLTTAQMTTGNLGRPGGGTWWLEGAADWFATLALPAPDYMPDRINGFDHEAPTTAINDMAYEAVVFFDWLGGAHGPNSVLPFLQQMANSTGEGAQRAAMLAALPADEWLHFAEDYSDQHIRDGQGASINSTPADGPAYEWDDTRTQRVDLAPFTIRRAKLSVHCGRWRFAPAPARYNAGKPEGGAWGDLPSDLDNLANDRGDFDFVGFNASAEAAPLQLAVTRTARCEECGGVHQVDQCLIGTWELTVDGAAEFAREHFSRGNVSITSHVGNTITLRSDGTFVTGASHVEAEGSTPEMHGQSYLNGQAAGRWSAAGGTVNYCADSASLAGQLTITSRLGTTTAPLTPTVPSAASHSYTCNGDTYVQTTQVGTVGTVRSTYRRISH
jgi:hypothetical protein